MDGTKELINKIKHLIGLEMLLSQKKIKTKIEIGRLLTDLKEKVNHGKWLGVLEEIGIKDRTASRYMRLVKVNILANPQLPISAKLADLKVPDCWCGENKWEVVMLWGMEHCRCSNCLDTKQDNRHFKRGMVRKDKGLMVCQQCGSVNEKNKVYQDMVEYHHYQSSGYYLKQSTIVHEKKLRQIQIKLLNP